MYLQADKHGDFCAISNGDLAHQITSERETAQIRVVVSLSVNKSVEEFLRYLYRCGNGAIPPISPETTKNDPTLEPLAAEPFDLDNRIIAYPTIFFILRTVALVPSQILNRTLATNPPVLAPSKNSDAPQTGSRNRRPGLFDILVGRNVPHRP